MMLVLPLLVLVLVMLVLTMLALTILALRQGGFVYYRPYDATTPIEQLVIVAAIPQRAIEFVAASSAKPVTDITLKDLTLRGSGANYSFQIAWDNGPTSPHGEGYQSNFIMTSFQQGQLYFENASGVVVEGCELAGAGTSGVWMQGYSVNNSLLGNVIRDCGEFAIYMSGYCRASSTEDRRRRLVSTASDASSPVSATATRTSKGRERARLREAYQSRQCTYNSFGSPEETYVSHHNTISNNYVLDVNR